MIRAVTNKRTEGINQFLCSVGYAIKNVDREGVFAKSGDYK